MEGSKPAVSEGRTDWPWTSTFRSFTTGPMRRLGYKRACLMALVTSTLLIFIWGSNHLQSAGRVQPSIASRTPYSQAKLNPRVSMSQPLANFRRPPHGPAAPGDARKRLAEDIYDVMVTLNSTYNSSWVNPLSLSVTSKEEILCALYEKLVVPDRLVSKQSLSSIRKLCGTSNLDFGKPLTPSRYGVTPKKNVVFLKVHKAASTTVQNIFLRHSFWHQLNILLHARKLHINEHSAKIPRESIMKLPPNSTYNILCHHIMFNHDAMAAIFPNDTVYVGIVREPFDRFVSAFKYYGVYWKHKSILRCLRSDKNPLGLYMNNPTSCEPRQMRRPSQIFHRMIRDFGFPLDKINAGHRVARKYAPDFVSHIKNSFDLIMVVERFDESLILLRRLLGWSLEDMLYFKLNQVETFKNNSSAEAEMDPGIQERISTMMDGNIPELRQLFNEKQPVEVYFYETFSKILNDILNQQKTEFWKEVSFFQEVKKRVQEFCNRNEPHRILTIQPNQWTPGIKMSKVDCFLLYLDELQFTTLIRTIQTVRFATLPSP